MPRPDCPHAVPRRCCQRAEPLPPCAEPAATPFVPPCGHAVQLPCGEVQRFRRIPEDFDCPRWPAVPVPLPRLSMVVRR